MMTIGSIDFVRNLRDAEIVGVAYGFRYCEALKSTLPFMSLIGRNATPLKKAFEEFEAWSKQSDGDAAEMTVVFLKSGGYIVGLNPEPRRLEQRAAGFNRTYQPLYSFATWQHNLTAIGPQVQEFRKYKQGFLSPFLLSADVTSDAIMRAPGGLMPRLIQVSPGILKFEATFIDEEDVQANTIPASLIAIRRGNSSRSKQITKDKESKGRLKPSPAQLREIRASTLRTHFPVNMNRIAQSKTISAIKAEVLAKGAQEWQFVQALCNLALSKDMGSSPHFKDVPPDKFMHSITEALSRRYEVADGKSTLSEYTVDQVLEQVRLDTLFLLREIGSNAVANDTTSQRVQLERLGLL